LQDFDHCNNAKGNIGRMAKKADAVMGIKGVKSGMWQEVQTQKIHDV
jgi:hypothetical protein